MNSLIVACPACGQKNRIPADRQHRGPKCGRCGVALPLAGQAVAVELSDGEFQGFLAAAELPVLVDFYSPTCGPCQMMAPVVQSLARQCVGRALVAKIDTSRNPASAAQFQIRGVPAFLFFHHGRLVDQVVGAVPEAVLAQRLAALG